MIGNKFRHGGNVKKYARMAGAPEGELIDFSANINPLGPPTWLRQVVSASLDEVAQYPDTDCDEFVEAVCAGYDIDAECVVAGNGATELIHAIPKAVVAESAVIPVPSYTDYENACRVAGIGVKHITLSRDDGFGLRARLLENTLRGGEIVFIGRPNNPVGDILPAEVITRMAESNPETWFVVDESFGGFVDGFASVIPAKVKNIITVVSLTKLYAIPGLRIGFLSGSREICEKIKNILPPWSVNVMAQKVGAAALRDREYVRRTVAAVGESRSKFFARLGEIDGLTVFPAMANYFLVRIDKERPDAEELFALLIKRKMAIRTCGNFPGLDHRYFRIAVKTEDENNALADALTDIFAKGSIAAPFSVVRKRTPALCVMGVSSSAGKSLITSAFCRILRRDGYRVAPFKSQNMSLNSYVTLDGKEIARAQATQARAAGVEPDIRMNPILLKPTSDTHAQVILRGAPVGSMSVAEYTEFKKTAFEAVKTEYDSLAVDYDAIIIEGAGSPGEMNLKSHDIVNMPMARYAGAKVVIVGDIDRGGVFASFIGTMETLEEWERRLTAGFIVNKFRGDPSLLDSAFEYTRRFTNRPVLGTIPYIHGLAIHDEDRPFAGVNSRVERGSGEIVDIVVINLPHISNATDFDPLMVEPDVRLRVVTAAHEFGDPDVVIIPGSKNVIDDLETIKTTGIIDKILLMRDRADVEIIGICGGFQMLGRTINDPFGIETDNKKMDGINLLPIETTLLRDKTLVRAQARHKRSGVALSGYEIHHGESVAPGGCAPSVIKNNGEIIGFEAWDGRIWGSYLHGIFDSDEFRRWFIDTARVRKGYAPIGHVVAVFDMEKSLDTIADVVRQNTRMDEIYRVMGLR